MGTWIEWVTGVAMPGLLAGMIWMYKVLSMRIDKNEATIAAFGASLLRDQHNLALDLMKVGTQQNDHYREIMQALKRIDDTINSQEQTRRKEV